MRKKYEGTGNAPEFEDEVTIRDKKILKATERAWGVDSGELQVGGDFDGKPKLIWLPRSQVIIEPHQADRASCDIRMSRKLAQEKFPDDIEFG